MFAVATSFNKDISTWNVSSGTNFVSGVNQQHLVISSLRCGDTGTMVLVAVMMVAAFLARTSNKQTVIM